jgi:hypothetical protein
MRSGHLVTGPVNVLLSLGVHGCIGVCIGVCVCIGVTSGISVSPVFVSEVAVGPES